MAIRIVSALLTALINAVVAVVVLFVLLLGMNGFNEHDANWGLGAFLLISAGAVLGSAFAAASLIKVYLVRAKSSFAAALLAISICSASGIFLIVVASFAALTIAEYARRHH